MRVTPVLVALGSNVGDRVGHIQAAIALLRKGMNIQGISPLYRTAPMYVTDQPEFLNGALLAETDFSPRDLLKLLKETEAEVGRMTRDRNGPREIDLDLIAYGAAAYLFGDDHRTILQIPHPKTAERRFVLQPLNDIAPDFLLPGIGVVREILAQTECQSESVMPYEDAAISL